MSKIYKALEKAERERKLKKKFPFPSEIEEDEKRGSREIKPDLQKEVSTMSNSSLVSFFQPSSLASEQFRKLRTHLLRFKNSELTNTIMVTSAISGEGKTFVAANLAIGISNHFHIHSLLVDCDLRNPQLAKWFGLENGMGLSDYLIGERKISDLLSKTEVEKLNILPGGSGQDNPTELIGSKKMEALVHELKYRYKDRYIIFDTTPLLATSEPEVLAKLVDGIIIVIKAGMTSRETLKQAIAPLEKEKILGFVLNQIQFKSSGLGLRYFGSDGYYYRYGYGKSKGMPPQSGWRKIFPFFRKSD